MTARVEGDEVVFSLADPDAALAGVRLYQEVARPRLGPEFERVGDRWEARFPRPKAVRIEYLFELRHSDGGTEMVPDPDNPVRASGAFGDKSVVELDDYRSPRWLDEAPRAGKVTELVVPSRTLGRDVHGLLWRSAGAPLHAPLPLLVVHDGPEYAEHSSLTRYLDVLRARRRIPHLRAALLAPPGDRDELYSASLTYARALALNVVPALNATSVVGMGASLGALAMLHAHRRHPKTFAGLFLQSGSYFQPRLDGHESGFPRWNRVTRFVEEVHRNLTWTDPIPVSLTAGTAEENLENNRALRRSLAAQGYDVTLYENPDAHNWVGWRDAFDPRLGDLLARVWGTLRP